MAALEIFKDGRVASINSITLLLPDPTISLLLHNSIRYFSYLVACMATIHSLHTGQRFFLPIARREGGENDPSRSAWQEADELVEVTMETLQSMRQRRMLAQRPWDKVNSDHGSPAKSFSHLERKMPDTSYPQKAHSHEVSQSDKVLLGRHVTTRSIPLDGVYAPRYNTSIKVETDRTNHHEM